MMKVTTLYFSTTCTGRKDSPITNNVGHHLCLPSTRDATFPKAYNVIMIIKVCTITNISTLEYQVA